MNQQVISIVLAIVVFFSIGGQAQDPAHQNRSRNAASSFYDFASTYGCLAYGVICGGLCTERLFSDGDADPVMLGKCFSIVSSMAAITYGAGEALMDELCSPCLRSNDCSSWILRSCRNAPGPSFAFLACAMTALWLLDQNVGAPIPYGLGETALYGNLSGAVFTFLILFNKDVLTRAEENREASNRKVQRERLQREKRAEASTYVAHHQSRADFRNWTWLKRILRAAGNPYYSLIAGGSYSWQAMNLRNDELSVALQNLLLCSASSSLGFALSGSYTDKFLSSRLSDWASRCGIKLSHSFDEPLAGRLGKLGELYDRHKEWSTALGLLAISQLDPRASTPEGVPIWGMFLVGGIVGGVLDIQLAGPKIKAFVSEIKDARERQDAREYVPGQPSEIKAPFERASTDPLQDICPPPSKKAARSMTQKGSQKKKQRERLELERQAIEEIEADRESLQRRIQLFGEVRKQLAKQTKTDEEQEKTNTASKKRRWRHRGMRMKGSDLSGPEQEDFKEPDLPMPNFYDAQDEQKSPPPARETLTSALIWVLKNMGQDCLDQFQHFITSGAEIDLEIDGVSALDIAAQLDRKYFRHGPKSLVRTLVRLAKAKNAKVEVPILEAEDELAFAGLFHGRNFRAISIYPGYYQTQWVAHVLKQNLVPLSPLEMSIIDKVFATAPEMIFIPNNLLRTGRYSVIFIDELLEAIKASPRS